MTAQNFMADHAERMGNSVAHFIASTDPELLNTHFETSGVNPTRSIFELVSECVATNRYFAALLRGEQPARPEIPIYEDAEIAQADVIDSANVLAAAIRAASDDTFNQDFEHWSRGTLKGEILMMGAYRNMAYHSGQINLVQILNGDAEFHMPPTWLK